MGKKTRGSRIKDGLTRDPTRRMDKSSASSQSIAAHPKNGYTLVISNDACPGNQTIVVCAAFAGHLRLRHKSAEAASLNLAVSAMPYCGWTSRQKSQRRAQKSSNGAPRRSGGHELPGRFPVKEVVIEIHGGGSDPIGHGVTYAASASNGLGPRFASRTFYRTGF